MYRKLGYMAALICAGLTSPAYSNTYYVVTPDKAVAGTPDGSQAKPFPAVGAALTSGIVKGGDTLLLSDGSHGYLKLYNVPMNGPVIIKSLNEKKAHFTKIELIGTTSNLTFQQLSAWSLDPASSTGPIIWTAKTTSKIVLDGLDIRSVAGSTEFMTWSAADWTSKQKNAIKLDGADSEVRGNRITGVYTGITATGMNAKIERNVVDGYNGDGIRPLGNNTVVRGNRIQNCVVTDANHDDGIQSWATTAGGVDGLTLDSNVIAEWTGAADHPLRCKLQGIGLFDGPYTNLVISNNLVVTDQYHGISVYGGQGVRIANNSVINARGITGTTPYIAVRPNKNGTLPIDVLVANNVAMSIQGASSTTNRVEFRNNSVIGTPSLKFQNPAAFDYRPKASSGYIDTADATVAPLKDVMDQKRPGGALPDRGAYETQVDGTALNTATLLTQSPEAIGTTTTGTTTTGTTTAGTTTTTTGTTTGTTTTGITTTTTTGGGGPKRIKIRTFR